MESGGAEKVFTILSNNFVDRGFDVTLILIKKSGPYLSQVDKRVRIIDLNCSRSIFGIYKYIILIFRHKPDFVISALDNCNIIASFCRLIIPFRAKLILTCHSTISSEFKSDRSIRSFLVKKLMKFLFPFADKVVAVSSLVFEDIIGELKLQKSKIQTIYNPVFSDDIIQLGKVPNNFEWFRNYSDPIFISIGRLEDVKNFALLIDSFRIVSTKIQAKLIIVGEGALYDELCVQINELGLSDIIHLAGFVDNPYNWLSNSDVFVLSSKWEGLSCALIEAMSFNLKIVSTKCYGGPREILENGIWGDIAFDNSPEELAKLMISAVSAPKNQNNIIRAKHFSVNNSISEYLNLFKSLNEK